MRSAEIIRKTAETDISLSLCLDGSGTAEVNTGCGFLNHMLTLFARHGSFDLSVTCEGEMDLEIASCGSASAVTVAVAVASAASPSPEMVTTLMMLPPCEGSANSLACA